MVASRDLFERTILTMPEASYNIKNRTSSLIGFRDLIFFRELEKGNAWIADG